MKIDINTIIKLEKLSNLNIDNKENMIKELESVLNFMENIEDFEYIKPKNIIENKDIFREDVVIKKETFKSLNKTNVEDNCFVVPNIIS